MEEKALASHFGKPDANEVFCFCKKASGLTLGDANGVELEDFFIKSPYFLSVMKGEEGGGEGFTTRGAAEALGGVGKAFEDTDAAFNKASPRGGGKGVKCAGRARAIGRGEVCLTLALSCNGGFIWKHENQSVLGLGQERSG